MTKIFDCITFFNENFITNLRFEVLNEVVDYFVICESMYDHQGKVKDLNFRLKNNYKVLISEGGGKSLKDFKLK